MIIYAATGNEHKRQELSQLFAPNQIIIPKDKGIDFDPEENGNTFVDNTIIKAKALYEIVKEPVIADDSGKKERQIRIYIRLTYLQEELLDMVDSKKITIKAAEKISFLNIKEQNLKEIINSPKYCCFRKNLKYSQLFNSCQMCCELKVKDI